MWLRWLSFTTWMSSHSWWIYISILLFLDLVFKFIFMKMTQFKLILMRLSFLMYFDDCLLLIFLISGWMLQNTIFLSDDWVYFGYLLSFRLNLFIKNVRNLMFFMWRGLIKTLTKLWPTWRSCLNWWKIGKFG